MLLRAMIFALLLGWGGAAAACQCQADPTDDDPDLAAAELMKGAAAIIDAVVARPLDPATGAGEVLRATQVWHGPADATLFKMADLASFVVDGRREVTPPSPCTEHYTQAGQPVRVVLYGEPGGYWVSSCAIAKLGRPEMLAALARRLRRPEMLPPPGAAR